MTQSQSHTGCSGSRPLICTRTSATDTFTMLQTQIQCYRHMCCATDTCAMLQTHICYATDTHAMLNTCASTPSGCSSSRPLICTRDGGAASVCLGQSQTTQRPPGTLHVKHTTRPFLHLDNIIGKIPLAIRIFCSARLPTAHLALSSMLKIQLALSYI